MCYSLRHSQKAHAGTEAADGAPASEPGNLRPRLAGAIAAVLVGGLALAAFVSPQAPPPEVTAKKSAVAPAVPFELKTLDVVTISSAQRALPADDDVPTSVGKSTGDCHHGL
jgi:hypothetical protein